MSVDELTLLGDVTTHVSSGATPRGGEKTYLDSGPVMFIRSQHVHMNRLKLDDVSYISDDVDAQMKRSRVQLGDVLLNITGASIGRVATFNLANTRANVNQHVCIIRPDESRLHTPYLTHFLSRDEFQRKIDRMQRGGTRQALTFQQIRGFQLPLPPLSEQKRIAAILDKADAIRRKRQQAIQLTEQFLRSTFLDMFGDPVTNPKGWPITTLGEKCDMVTGYAFKSREYVGPTGVRLCRGANVLPDTIDWSDVCYWPASDEAIDQKYRICEGDVVLAMDRPWISSGLKVARITGADVPSLLVQRVSRLRSNSTFTSSYVYYSIRHPSFTRHCGHLMTETTVPHISPNDIRSYSLPDPPSELQNQFSQLVESSERFAMRLHNSRSRGDALFNSLIQRAFNGTLNS